MDNLVIEPSIESRENVIVRKNPRTLLILAGWAATLLLSQLPQVIARDFLGTDIPWIVPAWLWVALLIFAASFVWQALSPLRKYLLLMALIIVFAYVVTPFIQQTTLWQNVFQGQPTIVAIFGTRVLLAVETLIGLAVLALFGVKRKEMFQVRGDLNAPVEGMRLPGRDRPLRWTVFGTLMAILLGGLFFTFMAAETPITPASFLYLLPWLPLVVLSAVGNAFAEEGMYRAAPLALLEPLVGSNHAVWMTAAWFGLGHFYGGIPSGYAGLVMTGLLGLLLGKAMLDTRGMGWPMIIHVVLDTVVFAFLTMLG